MEGLPHRGTGLDSLAVQTTSGMPSSHATNLTFFAVSLWLRTTSWWPWRAAIGEVQPAATPLP